MRKILFLTPFIALTGCVSHLNLQQCQATDWQQVGVNDGSAGRPMRDLQKDIQDCAKLNFTLNTDPYKKGYTEGAQQFCTPSYTDGMNAGQQGQAESDIQARQGFCQQAHVQLILKNFNQGWNKGIGSFCTADNGYQFGLRGQVAPDVCPSRYQGRYMAAWHRGARIYCRKPANAFALGKAGQAYPAACDASVYPAFQAEYQRGQSVNQREGSLQAQINDTNDQINSIVSANPNISRTGDDFSYVDGTHITRNDRDTMFRLRGLVRDLHREQSELYDTQMTK